MILHYDCKISILFSKGVFGIQKFKGMTIVRIENVHYDHKISSNADKRCGTSEALSHLQKMYWQVDLGHKDAVRKLAKPEVCQHMAGFFPPELCPHFILT